jgi:hypothetical protein
VKLALPLLAAFAGWTAWNAMRTEGFLEADEVLHYLYARHAPANPTNLVHPWARPLYTALLLPFAQLGWPGARLFAVACGAAAALCAFLAGRALGWKTAASAIPFTFAQPLFFQQTSGVWTEIAFAAVLGGWMLALASGRPKIVAVFAALTPLVRPEGAVVVLLTAVLALLGRLGDRRDWPSRLALAAITASGLAAWWLAAWLLSGDFAWLLRHWPSNWSASSSYGKGTWTWLASAVPAAVPLVLLPLAVLGGFAPGMRRGWPVAGVVILVLELHAALWARGAFGSAGYARYFVTLAPAFGLLITGGIEILSRAVSAAPAIAWTLLAAAAAVTLLLLHPTATAPPPAPPDATLFSAVGKWLRTQDSDPALLSVHPFAYLGLDRVPRSRFDDFSTLDETALANERPGTWLLSEDRFLRWPASKIEPLGFTKVDVPDLGVALAVRDARHDKTIEKMEWSLWRKAGR